MTGVEMIAKERKRQIEEEMYSANHDASNMGLALAGAVYALPHEYRNVNTSFVGIPYLWPWEDEYWKPTPEDRVRELVKAGALIAAEIDRINFK